jgi:1-phosphofructokinase
LTGALEGGVDLLKLSDEQLVEGGHARGDAPDELWSGLERLHEAGAAAVLLSRADAPSLVLDGSRRLEVEPPRFEALNPRGAGDTMTAAAAAGLARGLDLEQALAPAAAAAALNVTRQGLGTGDFRAIERVAEHVEVREAGGGSDEPAAPCGGSRSG